MEMPEWQIHEYNLNLYILRQSGCTDYEKPFVYLLFGKQSALLLDTGSRGGNLAPTLLATVKRWLVRNQRQSIPLAVVHSHSHSDHTDGDDAIATLHDPAMPVTMVKATSQANAKFFTISHWPQDIGRFDLGDRTIDAIPIPGHDMASIALYDRNTAILFTGDSVYPGRLYISNLSEFAESNQRMIRFTVGKPVAYLLGCHIEQTRTPFLDYPIGTIYQPDETDLQMPRSMLFEVQEAILSLPGKPGRLAMSQFTLWPVPADGEMSPATKAAFEKVQKEQLRRKWDQIK